MHSPKRDQARVTARVTNDAAATPRATLKDGLVQHQWWFGLGFRMHPRFYLGLGCTPRVPGVSPVMRRDRVAWAAEGGHYRDAIVWLDG